MNTDLAELLKVAEELVTLRSFVKRVRKAVFAEQAGSNGVSLAEVAERIEQLAAETKDPGGADG